MSEKYIDLATRISDDLEPTMVGDTYIRNALLWLDEHPEQVPGRTITESEYRDTLNGAAKISGYGDDWERGFNTGLAVSGTKVVPDPEPTNAEKWKKFCEDLGINLEPWQIDYLSRYMDKRGVPAPEAGDE